MKEEELLYDIIFPKEENPNYINYSYFIGRSKRSIYKLKATINESQLNPIIICDGNNQNAFFVKVFENELERFLEIVQAFNFRKIKINSRYMNEVKYMFGEDIMDHKKKVFKSSQYSYTQEFNDELSNLAAVHLINENKPILKRAI